MRPLLLLLVLVASAPVLARAEPGVETSFADLPGWQSADPRAPLRAFRVFCRSLAAPTRTAQAAPAALAAVCRAAGALGTAPDVAIARRFFEARFTPRRVDGDAFFTGYYEPVVEGALARSDDFPVPLYAPPPATGRPLPDRAAIEAGALHQTPLVFLREPVDAFFVQVQGSARIRLRDGSLRRLVFAGRNGHPYVSIGKLLVERLHIPPSQMGMAQLRAWIRDNGQGPDEPGGRLMQENPSYIFFRFDPSLPSTAGPIGGAGISLVPLTSLAIDRAHWPYGLPFWLDTTLPEDGTPPFQRLMIAQDTGSAILGEARADIFFGSGPEAAARAGPMRQHGTLYVFWPR